MVAKSIVRVQNYVVEIHSCLKQGHLNSSERQRILSDNANSPNRIHSAIIMRSTALLSKWQEHYHCPHYHVITQGCVKLMVPLFCKAHLAPDVWEEQLYLTYIIHKIQEDNIQNDTIYRGKLECIMNNTYESLSHFTALRCLWTRVK